MSTADTYSVNYLNVDGRKVHKHAYRNHANAEAAALLIFEQGHSVQIVANRHRCDCCPAERTVISVYNAPGMPGFPVGVQA